jgi:hypothetical protein
MSLLVKTAPLNNVALKCLALVFGYGLWHCVSTHQKIQITQKIPVCFYNTLSSQTITAPESITITVYGARKDLFQTTFDSALHYDAHTLQEGTHTVPITKEQIFLPESVRLVHYKPTEITIVVRETDRIF